ncbi:MAG: hypothetical protein MRY32_01980 [Rickettsiales bacterium]|nr:hypothetical protein [Rickettsiales bacterium]
MEQAQRSEKARTLFEDLMGYINESKVILEKGDYLELNGLDNKVAELCEAVHNLTPEESKEYADDLDTMMQELDGLQKLFLEQRDRVGADLKSINQFQQASKAYKTAETGPVEHRLSNPYTDGQED